MDDSRCLCTLDSTASYEAALFRTIEGGVSHSEAYKALDGRRGPGYDDIRSGHHPRLGVQR